MTINVSTVKSVLATELAQWFANKSVPVAAVYDYMPATIKASPVVLVLDAGVKRELLGIGTQTYMTTVRIELHILVAAAAVSPLDEKATEELVNQIEASVADFVAQSQKLSGWQHLQYWPQAENPRMQVKYTDGNPYELQIVNLMVEVKG